MSLGEEAKNKNLTKSVALSMKNGADFVFQGNCLQSYFSQRWSPAVVTVTVYSLIKGEANTVYHSGSHAHSVKVKSLSESIRKEQSEQWQTESFH